LHYFTEFVQLVSTDRFLCTLTLET